GGAGRPRALRGGSKAVARPAPAATPPRVAVTPPRDPPPPPPAAPPPSPVAPSSPPRRVVKPSTGSKPTIDVRRAGELLDNMYLYRLAPRTAPWIKDSAFHLFNAPGISREDRAYAAFVYGMALAQM